MSLKIEFVERATQKGAKIAPLCREFGISRETGYKWLRRFGKDRDYSGLEERQPLSSDDAYAAAEELVLAVLESRRGTSELRGPKKLQLLCCAADTESEPRVGRPSGAFSSASARAWKQRRRERMTIIERVRGGGRGGQRRLDHRLQRLVAGAQRLALRALDRPRRIQPIRVLLVQVATPTMGAVQKALERLFRKHGVPAAIQCDNGTCSSARWLGEASRACQHGGFPRHSHRSLASRLPPRQRRARAHRDLSTDIEAMPLPSPRATPNVLDRWRQEFNHVRPHEALSNT